MHVLEFIYLISFFATNSTAVKMMRKKKTKSSATAKSTARPSWLVGVLYNISREMAVMAN